MLSCSSNVQLGALAGNAGLDDARRAFLADDFLVATAGKTEAAAQRQHLKERETFARCRRRHRRGCKCAGDGGEMIDGGHDKLSSVGLSHSAASVQTRYTSLQRASPA